MNQDLLDKITRIEERNLRVELDKAWEVSWTRFFVNTFVTYLTMVLLLVIINDSNPIIHALVPTVGYVLSTLSIPVVKKW